MKQNYGGNKLNFEIKFWPEFTEKYNELNKIKLELNCLKEINEKKKYIRLWNKEKWRIWKYKKMSEFTDIDVNVLIKENKILINKENEKLFKK